MPEGPRDLALVFLGASLVAGVGDPKGQGWVGPVVGRSQHPDLDAHRLQPRRPRRHLRRRAGALAREVPRRWAGRPSTGWSLVGRAPRRAPGITLARHRLNLANVLDDAASHSVATFVVGPPPTDDAELNDRLEVLADAQADVCARRGVPFVDCFAPLLRPRPVALRPRGRRRSPHHPGQAGYGLIAWLVLHNGWTDWLQIS